jgi:hypothetical protein
MVVKILEAIRTLELFWPEVSEQNRVAHAKSRGLRCRSRAVAGDVVRGSLRRPRCPDGRRRRNARGSVDPPRSDAARGGAVVSAGSRCRGNRGRISYLTEPRLDGLSVNVRADRALEVKMHRGSPGSLEMSGLASGRVDVWHNLDAWHKWSFEFGPGSELAEVSTIWTRIRKDQTLA